MEMGEQLYLEPWKSVLGHSILHYFSNIDTLNLEQNSLKNTYDGV